MLTISATNLSDVEYAASELSCSAIDAATIAQALRNDQEEFTGCPLDPAWAVFMNPAEDMTIPIYLCSIHFNAFKMAVNTGSIGVDLDVFGD